MQSGVAHLSQALGASPITFGDIVEGWDQTVGVITVVTPITKQESIFITSTLAYQAYVLLHLWGKNKNIAIKEWTAHFLLCENQMVL